MYLSCLGLEPLSPFGVDVEQNFIGTSGPVPAAFSHMYRSGRSVSGSDAFLCRAMAVR